MDRKISIRELQPELVDDYLRFFDDVYDNDPWLNFKNNPWWGGCYCTFYDDLRTEEEVNASTNKRSDNRSARRKTLVEGRASGLLAYSGSEVVGWCNVAPRGSYANPRYLNEAIADPTEKVGAITCFLVSSRYRSSGIGRNLLEHACQFVASWGFRVAEGYPRNPELGFNNTHEIPPSNMSFRGSLDMFLRSGFRTHKKLERFIVVRKQL